MNWSNRTLVLIIAVCAVGGFLIGSSSSQEPKGKINETEVGRYQIAADQQILFLIDTKTGRVWDTPSMSHPSTWRERKSPVNAESK